LVTTDVGLPRFQGIAPGLVVVVENVTLIV